MSLAPNLPIMTSRQAYDDADALIRVFGAEAGIEAAERADIARSRGNHLHFCHWRQIERMIIILSVDQSIGTVH
ncbi:hypothetical protein [Sphingorhabdus sp. Alg239-R122]|uniref:hypothetical protein n=1 Tax=Sphingorhabdus sp. Alg239-R122 TaxID=2305989 RepID=UPI0019670D10|nr:hypothetical protein [Sphingorhabdus sp. Alg239-R122]